MLNNECNNDNYVELKYNNDYIFLDNVPNEDYITINKINDVFTHIYLHNKNVNIENSDLKQNKLDEDINNYNYVLNHYNHKNADQSLFFYDENENFFLEKNIRVDKLNCDFKIKKSSIFKKNIEECYVDEDSKNQIFAHQPDANSEYKEDEQEKKNTNETQNITKHKLNNDAESDPEVGEIKTLLSGEINVEYESGEDDTEEEEDINNQITEYKEKLIMIETEIKIINNIIFNIKASNDKSIFNLNKFKTRLFNKKNCDTLVEQIKILSEKKKMIENTINDIYKLMKTYEK
jgi:hypothetical protein